MYDVCTLLFNTQNEIFEIFRLIVIYLYHVPLKVMNDNVLRVIGIYLTLLLTASDIVWNNIIIISML